MIFKEADLKGVYIIEIEAIKDERGFFARSFCRKEFEKYGLNSNIVQCNISYNKKKGILRGMHYQVKPHEEAKIVSCVKGSIYDVIIDLRPDSPSYHQWFAIELNAENYQMLYIPEGFAHGFCVLSETAHFLYKCTQFYAPEDEGGIICSDPDIGIRWPVKKPIVSAKDKQNPRLSDLAPEQLPG